MSECLWLLSAKAGTHKTRNINRDQAIKQVSFDADCSPTS
ncbi:hypothetical protein ABIC84_003828 [Mucilaginibacter sp. 3215]